jgi:hypothetical protein
MGDGGDSVACHGNGYRADVDLVGCPVGIVAKPPGGPPAIRGWLAPVGDPQDVDDMVCDVFLS